MLAQRTSERAALVRWNWILTLLQARENIQASPWAEKMALSHQDINDLPKVRSKIRRYCVQSALFSAGCS